MLSRLRSRRWLPWAVLGVSLVVLGAGGAALLALRADQSDVSNPDVEFRTQPPPAQPPQNKGPRSFDWPVYGFDKGRTHYLPLERPFRPPFGERWGVRGSTLLEFTPALGKRSLFLLKNNAALYGVTRKTGKVRWKRKLGYLAASTPAYAHNTVYATILLRGKGTKGGRIVAVSAKDGRTRWSRRVPSRTESSPLIDRGTLYFGTENGTVYALRASDGFVRWRYRAKGAVKGGIALDERTHRLYFGDYAGQVTALRKRDGRRLWRKSTSGGAFGLGSGNFYSTAAVAFGRVYIGNTDGNVYSYSARNGALAWRKKTSGYVYASPAVAQVPGGRPTVYVGSYDGTFYALDARSGRVRWSRKAEGRISGGATVLGDLVFYSTLNHHTTALGAVTGRRIWSTRRGAFHPVVSDGRGLFLNGYTNLFGIDGRPPRGKRKPKGAVKVGHRIRYHGHRHRGRGAPPRCHRHGHHKRRGHRVIRYTHTHCHRHLRRR
jgi:outer membrane protein assembly factor BamB